MLDRKTAETIAHTHACTILLDDYEAKVEEEGDNWLFTYTPKGRIRGGGFKLTISKTKQEVIEVLRFQ